MKLSSHDTNDNNILTTWVAIARVLLTAQITAAYLGVIVNTIAIAVVATLAYVIDAELNILQYVSRSTVCACRTPA